MVSSVTKRGKRILLLAPFGNLQAYWFPMALGYLKSNMPSYHKLKIVDCTLENMPPYSIRFKDLIRDFQPDIVAISTSSMTSGYALTALKIAKSVNKEIITVIGGSHASIYPENVMKNDFVDFLFRGESEISFSVFLENMDDLNFAAVNGLAYRKNGKIVINGIEFIKDLDKIKIPDYHALNLNRYIEKGYNYGGFHGKTAPIWTTRGCPYGCKYCSASLVNGKIVRTHSIGYLIEWIKHLYMGFGIRQFSIVDDNFTFHVDYAKDFCREIIKRRKSGFFSEKIYFTTPNGVRMEWLDKELLVLMKKAGWTSITIAPESGSKRTLKLMGKGLNPDIVPGVVDMIKSVGLDVRAFFMVGYPGETRKDLNKTVRLIRKCKLDNILIGRFVPFPGTPVFDDLVKSGGIPPNYEAPQVFKLVLPFQKKVRERLYTPPGFEDFSLSKMFFLENFLLIFRNPHCLVYFVKYYGILNVIKKLYSLAVKSDNTK